MSDDIKFTDEELAYINRALLYVAEREGDDPLSWLIRERIDGNRQFEQPSVMKDTEDNDE